MTGVKPTIHGLISSLLVVLCASQAVAQKTVRSSTEVS